MFGLKSYAIIGILWAAVFSRADFYSDVSRYNKVQNISDVLLLKNTTQILFIKKFSNELLEVHPFKNTDVIRSIAVLLQISDGVAFQHGSLGSPGIVDEVTRSIFTFHQWELIIADDEETRYTPIHRVDTYDEVMTFAIPYSWVFSHIVGSMLPKLHFTCDLLMARVDIFILINGALAYDLFCEVCPAVCVLSEGGKYSNRFIFQTRDSKLAIKARKLYVPLYIATDDALESCGYCSGDGGNDVGSVPPNTIQLLETHPNFHPTENNTRQFHFLNVSTAKRMFSSSIDESNVVLINTTISTEAPQMRTLVYMPRPRQLHHYRIMDPRNEALLLQAICDTLSYNSNIQLSIFKSKGNYKADILQKNYQYQQKHRYKRHQRHYTNSSSMLKSARVILSPHSGSLANVLFAPADAVVMELVDYDLQALDRANFFITSLVRAVGLKHIAIKPLNFSMWNPTSIRVDASKIIAALVQCIPEIRHNPFDKTNAADLEHQHQCHSIVAKG